VTFQLTLTKSQEQVTAAALCIIPLVAMAAAVVWLVLSWSEYAARTSALLHERAILREVIAAAPAARERTIRLHVLNEANAFFYAHPQAAKAASSLRSEIDAIVVRDGGTLQRDDVELVSKGDDAPVELHAAVSLSADIRTLTRILYHLRQARPLVFVAQLMVHGTPGGGRTAPNRLQVDTMLKSYLGAS
jgi:hypothetical protein